VCKGLTTNNKDKIPKSIKKIKVLGISLFFAVKLKKEVITE